MIRPIVRDTFFLGQKSEAAAQADISVGQDLQDTLTTYCKPGSLRWHGGKYDRRKRIIIVNIGFMNLVMYNPLLLKKDTPYETEEGCLSLEGVRKATRYQNIEVEYLDGSWKKHRQKFSGWVSRAHRVRKLLAHRARKWTAQIILHELDHLEGVII